MQTNLDNWLVFETQNHIISIVVPDKVKLKKLMLKTVHDIDISALEDVYDKFI